MNIQRIGVIGGGQLAWMMAKEAKNLHLDLMVQTPSPDDPAVSLATRIILGEIDDAIATWGLAKIADVITFENEFIDLEALKPLEEQGVCFRPSLTALSPLLDKYDQRCYLQRIGLPVPNFRLLSTFSASELENLPYPFVLKARRHGYDGQGTFIVKSQEELEEILRKIPLESLIWEERVNYERELAVMVARNLAGEIVTYPVVETYQKHQVCHWVFIPAQLPQNLEKEVKNMASTLVEQLQVVGILGIEFFLTQDGRILINEIAPRTHNSGHYTLDACHTSQFRMQLQAVADLELGNPQLKTQGAVMVNLLGLDAPEVNYRAKCQQLQQIPQAYLHWYGKTESRPGRKLGHITVLINETDPLSQELTAIAQQIESLWYA